MVNLFKQSGLAIRISSVLLGLIISVLAIQYGQLEHGYRFLQRYPPDFTFVGWLKILATVGAAGLILFALKPNASNTRGFFDELPYPSICIGISVFVAALLVGLMVAVIFVPASLTPVISEGAVVEVLSEMLLAGTVITALLSLRKAKHIQQAHIGLIPATVPLLAIAVVAFLILMEEMSWGQHKFGFGTPDVFAGNIQNETNLHNFYTYRVDLVYYSSAFLVFMLLPWLWPKRPSRVFKLFSFYIPPSGLILISAPVCGLFYESWNTVPFQIILYLGILILVHSSMDATRGAASTRLWCGFLAALIIFSQIIFLAYGQGMTEKHELSEFRELLISALMFLYTLWLAWKLRDHRKMAATRHV